MGIVTIKYTGDTPAEPAAKNTDLELYIYGSENPKNRGKGNAKLINR